MIKLILTILTAITLNANCDYYVNEFNNSKIAFETFVNNNAPYKIANSEKQKIIYYLENAERLCDNKEYYRTLIKFYEDKK